MKVFPSSVVSHIGNGAFSCKRGKNKNKKTIKRKEFEESEKILLAETIQKKKVQNRIIVIEMRCSLILS